MLAREQEFAVLLSISKGFLDYRASFLLLLKVKDMQFEREHHAMYQMVADLHHIRYVCVDLQVCKSAITGLRSSL